MNWSIEITESYVPLPPERLPAYLAALDILCGGLYPIVEGSEPSEAADRMQCVEIDLADEILTS